MSAGSLRKRKIAVLGSRSVGKSSLILQFIDGNFVENYYPTIESVFTKSIKHDGTEFSCDIIDTAGQDEYSILSSKHAIGIHGYVLVYSTTSRNSFNMIQIVYDKIIDFCGRQKIPCVIVGSKMDLKASRQVQAAEGQKLADDNHCAWIETSAKEDINVSKVFELCLAEIEKENQLHAQTDSAPAKPKQGCCIM